MGTNPKSHLSPGQIVQKCYDEPNDRIRVDAQYNASISGDLEIAIDSVDDSVTIGDDSGNHTTTTTVGADIGLDVNVIGGTITLPAGSATAANQVIEIASLQILDDVPAGMNAVFNKANPISGQLDDTSTTVATEDNVAPVRITSQRAFHSNLRNNSGTEIATSSNPIRIDPTGTTRQPVEEVGASTATINTSVSVGTSSTTVLSANSNRKLAYILNNNGVKIYIKFGATAVSGEGITLSANGGMYEIGPNNLWLGVVNAIKTTGAAVPVEVFEATL